MILPSFKEDLDTISVKSRTTNAVNLRTIQYVINSSGLKAIMNRLNRSGYSTKQRKPFSVHTIRKILKNPVYIGKVRYTDSHSRKECIVDGEHEPIISLGLWKTVQKRYTEKIVRTQKHGKRDYPLTSLLRCPQCQTGMIGWCTKHQRTDGSFRTHYYYICSSYQNKGSTVCRPNAIPADSIESIVLNRLKQLILHPKLLKDVIESINQQSQAQLYPLKEQRQIIENQLKGIILRRKNLFHLFENDQLDKETLAKQLEYLKQNSCTLQAEQQKIEQKVESIQQNEISFQHVHQALRQFDRLWKPMNFRKKKELLHGLICKITIDHQRDLNSVQIHFSQMISNLVLSNRQISQK